MIGWRLLLLLSLVSVVSGVPATPTQWTDVCEAEDYVKYRAELCPEAFFVSTIAFDPLEPKLTSTVTLILQPSESLQSTFSVRQQINIELPDFEPYSAASIDPDNQLNRLLQVTPQNPAVVGQDPSVGYNTAENPLFDTPAKWDTSTSTLMLQIKGGNAVAILKDVDTEIRVCCLVMPQSSPRDFVNYTIVAPTTTSGQIMISTEPVMRSPFLDPGFQWDFLQVYFDPPLSMHLAVISLTLRSATDLGNRNRIILHLPSINREPAVSGVIEFNTAASADPNDWMLFAHEALWDNDKHTITFFLRAGATLKAGKQVTLRTNPNEYRLPVDIESNWPQLQVEARSFDDIDMIIRPTPVSQASRVPHVRNFTMSQLTYSNNQPYGMSNVEFTFMTNRPMFVGSIIYLRLAGFQAQVVDVFLLGESGKHFQDQRARLSLPENLIELRVNKTFYSNEKNFTVVLADMFLPAATYENDPALMVKNSDPIAEWQSIQISPPIGTGTKEFIQSQLLFSPMEPRMPANITFIVKPSVIFYQGDKIIFHLYSFLYSGTTVHLHGAKAHYIKNSQAEWIAGEHMLIFEVATNEIILNTEPFSVTIDISSNFRLPDKLSKNDGICRIEGLSATGSVFIDREPMKKTPKIGEDKYVIESRIEFEPLPGGVLSDSIARIRFKLILNTDVLPNSTVFIKLGALTRAVPSNPQLQSGKIHLSGANAPLFVGNEGDWNADTNYLSIKIVHDVQIYAGERITFFLERDQYFKLPYAMYPRDPSFRIKIPEAGISERPFNFSTRVSQDTKQFVQSLIYYGTSLESVAYPNTVVDMTIKFQANVNIPAGSIIRITLPGYTYPTEKVLIRSPETQVIGELHLTDVINHAVWNQLTYEMDLVIPVGKQAIPRTSLSVMKIVKADGGFRLPSTSLAPNDLRLTIAVVENQIIYSEPIKQSPRVVSRSFARSEFLYLPPVPESIFQLKMILQPTVNITKAKPIIISLYGFNNSFRQPPASASCVKIWLWDCPTSIHILGPSRGLFEASMGWWNQSTNELLLEVVDGSPIDAFTVIDIFVAENQGFTLPETLNENDTRITIRSYDNILAEPIKSSPMIGDGPRQGHLFCMMQYERGVRTNYAMTMCDVLPDCLDPNPPLDDPCSPAELIRCGCSPLTDDPVNFTIHGFQLQASDTLQFLPWDTFCGSTTTGAMGAFSPPQEVFLSADRDKLDYENISSIDSGYFRICMLHNGAVYQVGKVVVRPSCQSPLVLVDGVCVHNCPKTKIPVAGNCVRDPNAVLPEERQALMIPIRIDDPTQTRDITFAAYNDAERKYFEYRFQYDLASLLNCDSSRIIISSLSSGTAQYNAYYPIIINTIFSPAVDEDTSVSETNERSPLGLVTLLKALQADMSSAMYSAGSLFANMNRTYDGKPIKVRKCDDDQYRVFCPYGINAEATIMNWGESAAWYWIGTVVIALAFIILGVGVWFIDSDRQEPIDPDIIDRLQKDPKQIAQPEIRLEFARSWLEGRFMGERWQKARDAKLLAIGPH